MVEPNSDSELRAGYGCGLVLALVVAIAFAFKFGVLVAAFGLVIALPIVLGFYLVMKSVVYPLIDAVSRAIGKALGDE